MRSPRAFRPSATERSTGAVQAYTKRSVSGAHRSPVPSSLRGLACSWRSGNLVGFVTKPVAGSLPSAVRTPLAKLAAVTSVATYLLIVLGAVVRATGSGLGCPDWPTCHGSWIPPLEEKAIIEYSHRTLAAVVGLLVAGVLVMAWRSRREDQRSWWQALAAFGLLLVQAWLGRQVVLTELSPGLVSVHLGTAMSLLALLMLIALPRARAEPLTPLAWKLWTGTGAVFLVILIGALVRGADAGPVFQDWPLMNGALVPGLDSSLKVVHFFHRLLAATVGVYLVYLWVSLRATGGLRRRAAGATLVSYSVQGAIGAAVVATVLADWTVVAHVAVAGLTWMAAFLLPYAGSLQPAAVPEGRT